MPGPERPDGAAHEANEIEEGRQLGTMAGLAEQRCLDECCSRHLCHIGGHGETNGELTHGDAVVEITGTAENADRDDCGHPGRGNARQLADQGHHLGTDGGMPCRPGLWCGGRGCAHEDRRPAMTCPRRSSKEADRRFRARQLCRLLPRPRVSMRMRSAVAVTGGPPSSRCAWLSRWPGVRREVVPGHVRRTRRSGREPLGSVAGCVPGWPPWRG